MVLAGRMVGRVEQAVLTGDGKRLRGIVVRQGLGAAKWVDVAKIRLIGQVSVIVDAKPTRLPDGVDFTLTTVKDTGGMSLGRVTDVYLAQETLETVAVELSLGLFERLSCGRMIARTFAHCPAPGDPGQILIPCGARLERLTAPRQ